MGLKMTLAKENNHLNYDFINAYWSISELSYDTQNCYFRLKAYPSREAKLSDLSPLATPTLPMGGASYPVVNCSLYLWEAIIPIVNIFPDGIPLDENEQKTAIYKFIKEYTELPFEDVFEEDNNG
jgi:hypothetical protein